MWNKEVKPYMNAVTGIYQPPAESSEVAQATNTPLTEEFSNTSADSVLGSSKEITETNLQRRSSSYTPPTLIPASKRARLSVQDHGENAETTTADATKMDQAIQNRFVGMPLTITWVKVQ